MGQLLVAGNSCNLQECEISCGFQAIQLYICFLPIDAIKFSIRICASKFKLRWRSFIEGVKLRVIFVSTWEDRHLAWLKHSIHRYDNWCDPLYKARIIEWLLCEVALQGESHHEIHVSQRQNFIVGLRIGHFVSINSRIIPLYQLH